MSFGADWTCRCGPLRHVVRSARIAMAVRAAAVPVVAMLFASAGAILHAQDSTALQAAAASRVLVGLRGGYEYGLEQARFPVFASSAECGEFVSGRASAAFGGAGLNWGSLLGGRVGIALGLDWVSASGLLTATPLDPLVILDSVNDVTPSIQHEYRFASAWHMLRADLQFDIRVADRFAFRVGPWIAVRTAPHLSQTDNIVNEPVYRFEGGLAEHTMTAGEQLTATSIAVGLGAGIAYQAPLGRGFWLVPELGLRTELTSATSEVGWRTFTGGAALGLMYDLASPAPPPEKPPEPPPVPPANPVADNPPHRMNMRVRMDLYGIDEAGGRLPAATIRINEVLYRERSPLLGPIFFDPGAGDIPRRYIRLTRDRASGFNPDSLGADPLGQHYQSLNLLGYHLRRDPSIGVAVTGYVSRGEPAPLALTRAAQVGGYLRDVWGIDSARIGVEAGSRAAQGTSGSEDNRAEERRVEISLAAPAGSDPAYVDRLARSIEPPLIALDPSFDSVGVKKWTIVLSYDGKEVGRYSSLDTGLESKSTIHWQIPDDQPDLMHTFLVGELTVEDSTGFEVSSRTQTPLTLERTFRIVERSRSYEDREALTYSLLAFARNSADLDARNSQIIREIADSTRSGAVVNVVGYTDRTGATEVNRKLSIRRAANTANALRALLRERGVRNVQISTEGRGYEEGRFDNVLPEGRVLSREVNVIVDQRLARSQR